MQNHENISKVKFVSWSIYHLNPHAKCRNDSENFYKNSNSYTYSNSSINTCVKRCVKSSRNDFFEKLLKISRELYSLECV